ncbi:unnamed protein product [Mytilus coruscus]|uniref:Uncharacterized protein n=1 Tax=Mytilus coruscus TaxID=42192 RepID=A0A6J8AZ63_MYTCO|nr:unnamed protein product [Mytilus coruscus]
MWTCNACFPSTMIEGTIHKEIHHLVNILWYLDGNKQKIMDRSALVKEIHPIPQRFLDNFNNFNDWQKKKQKAPFLSSEKLKTHSSALFSLISLSYTHTWGDLRKDLEAFALSLDSNVNIQVDQSVKLQIDENSSLQHFDGSKLNQKYSLLEEVLSRKDMYQYILFDEKLHAGCLFKTNVEKFNFFSHIQLLFPVDMMKYSPGGSFGTVIFFWKTPEGRKEDEIMTSAVKVVSRLKPSLPEFHTRQMRREFFTKFCHLPVSATGNTVPPYILRAIYRELTLDATADQNKALDERVRQALLAEDSDLVTDLRHINPGRLGDTFNEFFENLHQKVEQMVAADERRHNVEHMATYLSVRDLKEQVEKDLEPGSAIPSESSILYAFVPKNAHANTAKLYKSKIPLQFKIQTRQLRVSHQDDHYCSAIFKYIRQFAIKFRDCCKLLCIDDKAKIDFGEPGMAVYSDEGKVSVIYKDSIFMPSSPWRHATEICQMLQASGEVPPLVILFSDGGPDHGITYHAVKLSLIVMFKKLDLDMLVAGRTAPGNSWVTPAERIMSLLNIAAQNVALTRSEMNSEMEQIIKSANSMSDIRSKAEKIPRLKISWIESVQAVIDILIERTKRVALKAVPFDCPTPSDLADVKAFEHLVKEMVDDYMKFLEDHCRQRAYMFQIRKCQNINCCLSSRSGITFPWVPDPMMQINKSHYEPFEKVLGTDTNESDKPSAQNTKTSVVAEQMQGILNAGLVGQNVRRTVSCYECGKPRCIYAKKTLTSREARTLNRMLEKHDYTCGCIIVPEDDTLHGIVHTRLQMECRTPVEFSYYADNTPIRLQKDICCYCASPNSEKDAEEVAKFKVVLPICNDCKNSGKPIIKRNPKKN